MWSWSAANNCNEKILNSFSDRSGGTVDKGKPDPARSLAGCKSACSRFTKCTGISWSSANKCWFHGNWAVSETESIPGTGVTQYDLKRSQVSYWVEYPGLSVYEDSTTDVDMGLLDCKRLCIEETSCTQINAKGKAGPCNILDFSLNRKKVKKAGWTNYELMRGTDQYVGMQLTHCFIKR